MKKLIFILIQILFISNVVSAVEFFKNCDEIVETFYVVCYDYTLKSPIAVNYVIHEKTVNLNNITKRPGFYRDKTLPKEYSTITSDYTKTGYDRGHIASDSSFDWDDDHIIGVYSMINIVPQTPRTNRNKIFSIEVLERKLSLEFGTIEVIELMFFPKNPKRIGKSQLAVPSAFAKILINKDTGIYKECFWVDNNDINVNHNPYHYKVSCNLIETRWNNSYDYVDPFVEGDMVLLLTLLQKLKKEKLELIEAVEQLELKLSR
jgi:endonuclease G, mitochondrial